MRVKRLPALVFVLGVTACAGVDRDRSSEADTTLPRDRWVRVEPGGDTACARGGRYAFWVRGGDPRRLLVFFQGGGGCFDAATCAEGSAWFDDRVDGDDDPAYAGGILARDDRRNPFRGWSVVYLPSCTGDVHLGDAVHTYEGSGARVTIRHKGWVNARAALDWAFDRFPSPSRVLVAGCSAGSVGSAFHVPAVLERYPHAAVTQLGDSLAFEFHRRIRLVDWGAHDRFPAFFRIGDRRFAMSEYVEALARRYPDRVFARFNHAGDDVQEQFYEAVGGRPGTFEPLLRRTEESLVRRLPNYRSFLACGSDHGALPDERFHSVRTGGVSLRDWVVDLAAGRRVTCPRCG